MRSATGSPHNSPHPCFTRLLPYIDDRGAVWTFRGLDTLFLEQFVDKAGCPRWRVQYRDGSALPACQSCLLYFAFPGTGFSVLPRHPLLLAGPLIVFRTLDYLGTRGICQPGGCLPKPDAPCPGHRSWCQPHGCRLHHYAECLAPFG